MLLVASSLSVILPLFGLVTSGDVFDRTPWCCPKDDAPASLAEDNFCYRNNRAPLSVTYKAEDMPRCLLHQRLTGDRSRTCLAFEHGAEWSGEKPRCINVTCDFSKVRALPYPGDELSEALEAELLKADNTSDDDGKTYLGDRVVYSCREGYKLIGNRTLQCIATGWNGTRPKCEALCPRPRMATLHSDVKITTSRGKVSMRKYFESKEIIRLSCQRGTTLYPQTSSTLECEEGKWVHYLDRKPPAFVICYNSSMNEFLYDYDKRCSQTLPRREMFGPEALVTCKTHRHCTYSCQKGYYGDHEHARWNRSCQVLGSGNVKWRGPSYVCKPRKCAPLPQIITGPSTGVTILNGYTTTRSKQLYHGERPTNNTFVFGDAITYKCASGPWAGHGVRHFSFTCQDNGQWLGNHSGRLPQCGIVCQRCTPCPQWLVTAPSPFLSTATGPRPWRHSKVITVFCTNRQFCLSRQHHHWPLELRCECDGSWRNLNTSRHMYCSHSTFDYCRIPDYQHIPGLRLHVPHSQSSTYPSRLLFTCKQGFYFPSHRRSVELTCHKEGRWPQLPKCQPKPELCGRTRLQIGEGVRCVGTRVLKNCRCVRPGFKGNHTRARWQRRCQATRNGTVFWTNNFSCRPAKCNALPSLPQPFPRQVRISHARLDGGNSSMFVAGDRLSYMCMGGRWSQRNSPTLIAVCCQDGNWTPRVLPHCYPDCGLKPRWLQQNFTLSSSSSFFTYGESLTISCHPGFGDVTGQLRRQCKQDVELRERRSFVCGTDGKWRPYGNHWGRLNCQRLPPDINRSPDCQADSNSVSP